MCDYKCTIDSQCLTELEATFCEVPHLVDSDFAILANTVMHTFHLSNIATIEQSLELYFLLLEI